jgi:hypothetical protein
MSAKAAGMIRPYMERALPAVVSLGNLVDVAEPYFCAALAYLQYVLALLQPYHPEEFMPAIAGFVLVFFGGNFFTLCAAVEAYRLVGFDDTKKALVGAWGWDGGLCLFAFSGQTRKVIFAFVCGTPKRRVLLEACPLRCFARYPTVLPMALPPETPGVQLQGSARGVCEG